MTAFKIHAIPGTPFARAVCATLAEKNATYRIAPIGMETMKTEAHLRVHPFGRMPAIDHDGFHLYETQAILRYVDRVLPTPALTPLDARLAAGMDLVMNVCDWYLFHDVANGIAFQRVVGPKLMGLTPDEAAIAAATRMPSRAPRCAPMSLPSCSVVSSFVRAKRRCSASPMKLRPTRRSAIGSPFVGLDAGRPGILCRRNNKAADPAIAPIHA
jgi:hypothetical protein